MTTGLQLQHCQLGHSTLLLEAELSVEHGEIVAILGPSGCGKSTLLATILGSIPALGGRIVVDQTDVTHLPIHRRRVGMVFQDPLLFSHLSVAGNVMYGLRRSGVPKSQARARAEELLSWVGLEGLADRPSLELSGGQAQRVALVRALAPAPAVLLLDEPYSALDADLRTRLASEVAALLREQQVTAVHVTHDAAEASTITDAVYRIADQRLAAS